MKLKMELPIFAYSEFYIDKPSNWDEMSNKEKFDYFLEFSQPVELVKCVTYDFGNTFVHTGISTCEGEIDEKHLHMKYENPEDFIQDLEEIYYD